MNDMSEESSAVAGCLQALVKRIADSVQATGRKHASGEPLFFDRYNLEEAIAAALQETPHAHPETKP